MRWRRTETGTERDRVMKRGEQRGWRGNGDEWRGKARQRQTEGQCEGEGRVEMNRGGGETKTERGTV